MTDGDSIVVFSCKKCGETFEAPVKNSGKICNCKKCETIIKIPGIALQSQATKFQKDEIHRTVRKFKLSMTIFCFCIYLFISAIIIFRSIEIILIGIFVLAFCFILLGYYSVESQKHLRGENSAKMLSAAFFKTGLFMLSPVFAVPIFIKIIKNENRLKKAGVREVKRPTGF